MMDNAFFFKFLFCPQLILQFIEGVQYFSKDPEGSNIFQAGGGGSNFFQGKGVLIMISKETHITCDFLGGVGSGPPIPPLDTHMQNFKSEPIFPLTIYVIKW